MITRFLSFSAILFVSAALAGASPNTWTVTTSKPTPVARTGGAVSSNVFYVVGGLSSGATTAAVEAYDPLVGTWSAKQAIPQALCDHGVVKSSGKIFVAGGRTTATGAPVATLYAYDTTLNSWSGKAPLLNTRAGAAIESIKGVIYLAGGDTIGGITGELDAYNTLTDTWITKALMPTARRGAVAVTVGTELFVMGGDAGTGAMTKVEAYDTVANTWRTLAPLPAARTRAGAGVLHGIVYLAGGNDAAGTTTSTVFAYDPTTDAWTPVSAPMPVAASAFAFGKLNGDLQVAAGAAGATDLSAAAAYTAGSVQFPVAASGDLVATNPAGAQFKSFGSPALNANGRYAFQATLVPGIAGVTTANNIGIWADRAGAPMALVTRIGDPAPGTPGDVFHALGDPVYDNSDRVSFRGSLLVGTGDATLTNYIGLWSDSSGTLSLVARVSSPAPGAGGANFAKFIAFALPDGGGTVFLAGLTGTGVLTSNNLGIWATTGGGTVNLIVRKGDPVYVNGQQRLVSGLTILPKLPLVFGQTRSFSPNGDLAYRATFTDGTSAILHVVTP